MLMNVIQRKPIKTRNKIIYHKLILMIRGHIRDSFENDQLYDFIKKLMKKYDIRIYTYMEYHTK